jgi:hypothetical protein
VGKLTGGYPVLVFYTARNGNSVLVVLASSADSSAYYHSLLDSHIPQEYQERSP